MDVDLLRQVEAGRLQHGGPEERMEVGDVLADEVVDLGLGAPPPVVELLAVPIAPLLGRGDVADGGVEPDVPVVAGAVGNLETEVGGRPRDVPIAERLVEEVALEVIGDLRLQGPAGDGPLVEEPVQPLDVHEEVLGLADLGRRPGERALGVDQVGGVVMRSRNSRNYRRIDRASCTWGTCP